MTSAHGVARYLAQDYRPADGWKWYEAHSNTLTDKQNEAVSLAYARQALGKGDVETARKWAAQVVTPKFKTKIEGEIATKAGGG